MFVVVVAAVAFLKQKRQLMPGTQLKKIIAMVNLDLPLLIGTDFWNLCHTVRYLKHNTLRGQTLANVIMPSLIFPTEKGDNRIHTE